MPPPLDADSSLWHFAVQAYARPGVAATCLQLQDEHGLDVDVLLACAWLAARGVALDREGLERMLQAAAAPHARVLELRALRRAVGSDRDHDPRGQATHEHAKAAELAAELAAERVELECIEAALCTATPASPTSETTAVALALALANLQRYAARHDPSSCERLLTDLAERVLSRSGPARD